MINPKKYVFDRYCPSHRSFLCFPIAAACTLTTSLPPSPSFPVSSDENPALVNPHLYFRPPLYSSSFSYSYNLIYYFMKQYVFFSSATITNVILLNVFSEFHIKEYMVKSFLAFCYFSYNKIWRQLSFVFVKYVASFLNSSTEPICLYARGRNKYSCSVFFSLITPVFLSHSHLSISSHFSLFPSSRKITILRGNSCRSRQNLINW